MTKQEEIKEVVDTYTDDTCLYPDVECKARGTDNYCRFPDDAYKCLMKRLDGLGVVIKVDRELPDNKVWHKAEREFEAYCAGKNELIMAGYVAIIPLIEKEHPIVTQLRSGFSGIIQAEPLIKDGKG